MGLGNFRFRIILILIAIVLFVFWLQMSSSLSPIFRIYVQDATSNEIKVVPNNDIDKVLITVYYECLCPDSRSFFLKQLVPAYQRIPENMILEFVPYGNAETIKDGDDYKFECQHEAVECAGNIVHACSIEFIKDQNTLLDFLTCMIQDNANPNRIMEQCAKQLKIEYDQIQQCAASKQGRDLLAQYGKMTKDLVPKVSFIPTITLNKSSDHQAGILKNLLKQVCLMLKSPPKGCE